MVRENTLPHRLKQAREVAGRSLRSLSRQTGIPVSELARQEEASDLRLSDLVQWKQALGVPLSELLHETPDRLDEVVQLRAGLIQLMRSTKSLLQEDTSDRQRYIASNMLETLNSLMPELHSVQSWPQFGSRRGRDEPSPVEAHMVNIANWFPEMGSEV